MKYTFKQEDEDGGHVTREKHREGLSEILKEFVEFLNMSGFKYVDSILAFDDDNRVTGRSDDPEYCLAENIDKDIPLYGDGSEL